MRHGYLLLEAIRWGNYVKKTNFAGVEIQFGGKKVKSYGGVLVVARAKELHAEYKAWLEKFGFTDVLVTDKKNDALNTIIIDNNPRLVIFDSGFYQAGTPRRIGELLRLFLKLNIAVVTLDEFPLSQAVWFIWEGANSYINLWEGYEEFCRGFRLVLAGNSYISPKVKKLLEQFDEVPDIKDKVTKRQKECLILLCCGLTPLEIGEALYISKNTVDNHLNSLYRTFHIETREEMIALAWEMELVTVKDIRFYKRKKERIKKLRKLPQWAVVKKKCDRFWDFV